MDDVSGYIRDYYDSQCELEWKRLENHRTEFALTIRALDRYLPSPPARLLDCGGGPGRYAIELAKRGYKVTLFDLSAAQLLGLLALAGWCMGLLALGQQPAHH